MKIDPVTVERLTTSFNEYYSVGGKAQTHDANGNLLTDGLHTFTWDAMNRMATASDNSGLIVTYLYDATNRRVAKVFPEGSDFADVQYAYSNWQVLGEYEDGMTYPSRQFVYGNYIDEPLVMDVNADASGFGNASCIGGEDARFFYHAGQIYSVAALSDASGVIVEGWRYDPYGRHVRLTDGDADGAVEFDGTDLRATLTASALGNPYTFTGRRFDPETGLHHYRNRYYDSRRGRFISRDPIGLTPSESELEGFRRRGYSSEIIPTSSLFIGRDIVIHPDGPNMYSYNRNNALVYMDPFGLNALCGDRDNMFDCKFCRVSHRKTNWANYPPGENGCGAENGINVPDSPISWGGLMLSPNNIFHDSCNKHDRCYGTCNNGVQSFLQHGKIKTLTGISDFSNRRGCDRQLLNNTRLACISFHFKLQTSSLFNLPFLPACLVQAHIYHEVVRRMGKGPYCEAQEKGCNCTCRN